MRILVIGGTRFIGAAVVRELVAGGHDVTVLHRGETERGAPAGVRHLHADRARIGEHVDEIADVAADVALDMTAMTEDDARSLLVAVRGRVSRLVVVSSMDVYRAYGRMHGSEPGPVEPLPLVEESPLREKLYPYRGEREGGAMDAYDKIPIEQLVMADDEVAGTVIRLPAVHGAGDYQRRVFMEVRRFEARRPFVLIAEEARGWRWARASVENAAHAVALCVTDERAAGRVYHVAEPHAPSQEEFVRECASIFGWDGEIVFAPQEMLPAHLRLPVNFEQSIVVDSSRIRDELGYAEVVEPREGLARAIAWEREHPPKRMPEHLLDYAAEDAVAGSVRGAAAE